eukprot:TRINITY_DN15758_c0_g1_i1.p1 TRINITY_DN15758_c0_g1~~TRINITY_DN15758_c0_g1_i1.p1  ORF type:complete len:104 (+),score=1.35 TRINITY_DN15758_c0_g1_i1:145-456(+)
MVSADLPCLTFQSFLCCIHPYLITYRQHTDTTTRGNEGRALIAAPSYFDEFRAHGPYGRRIDCAVVCNKPTAVAWVSEVKAERNREEIGNGREIDCSVSFPRW